jgi:hypothetical protein
VTASRKLGPFPAWYDFADDLVMRKQVVAHIVYADIIRRDDVLRLPVEVKGWVWARRLKVERKSLVRALDLLVERGYLQEHPRAHARAPRRFTVHLYRALDSATS